MDHATLADLIAVGVLLFAAAALPRSAVRHLSLGFARLARKRPAAGAAGLAALTVALRLALLPALPAPVPIIPDEHANLFLAQTLQAGRLSTPTHPMWRHFEALFILHRPTYASVYPPFQGALLALGSVLFHEPWAGVLAGVAGMCLAITWMLRAYMTRMWALYGGLLTGAGHGVLGYWANSYWGGAGAAIGGALVFGALPRILSRGRRRDAAILGLGLAILANSRPFEGLLAALPGAVYLLFHLDRALLQKVAPVFGCVAAAGAALTCFYFLRVTGNPLRPPHLAYFEQYAAAPAFVWQGSRMAPPYRDRFLRDAHFSFGIDYAEYATVAGAARRTYRKAAGMAGFYWGPLWVLVILASPELLRDRRFRVALLSLALCVAGILATVGFQLHYAAPCTAIFVLLLVEAIRRLSRNRRLGAVLVIAAPLAWAGTQMLHLRQERAPNSLHSRPAVEATIAAESGTHVVFVRYAPRHPLGQEWVYNRPDKIGRASCRVRV